MTIDQALDILRKCCENIDIDDNGHERECGKCEVCMAVEKLDVTFFEIKVAAAESAERLTILARLGGTK